MNSPMSRRSFLKSGTAAVAAGGAMLGQTATARADGVPTAKDTFGLLKQGKKIPVILDTDIGGDIDDTWALLMLLKSPELDVKLVTSDSGNDVYRARIIAKMLEVVGRTEIPVGIGLDRQDKPGRQSKWVGNYALSKYPGKVIEDGAGAIIETIHASADPISLVCIGPVPNIGAALRRDPTIARRARFVGMHGSVRRGYGNSPKISAEYNVRANPQALQAVFAADWDVTITPLDTCGIIQLRGERFRRVHQSKAPGVQDLMENYRVWLGERGQQGPLTASSTLFDTVGVYLAFTEKRLKMETLGLKVTDDGYTRIDPAGRKVHCALEWEDMDAFKDDLVARLTSA